MRGEAGEDKGDKGCITPCMGRLCSYQKEVLDWEIKGSVLVLCLLGFNHFNCILRATGLQSRIL